MTRNIIFPVNNKGGVGKTSVLTDLCAALAQRHGVGIVDFDDQASLAGTLLKRDVACRRLDEYDLDVVDAVLTPPTQFVFSEPLRRLTLDVAAARAKVTVFPAGLLYDHPERKTRLDEIVSQEMGEASFIAVDLPPIPHPGMVLDYTVTPMIKSLGGDVRLFPLIVATPDHNVIDIALRGFAKIATYFEAQGVSPEKIHPLFVLNKSPMSISMEEGPARSALQFALFDKLRALGLIYKAGTSAGVTLKKLNRHFDYDGRRYRSVVFPLLDCVQDGTFSLFYGRRLQLAQYPHLTDLVEGHHFPVPEDGESESKFYRHGLQQLVAYVVAKSGERPHKNYVKRLTRFDSVSVTSDVVASLRSVLEAYYRRDEEDTFAPPLVTSPNGGSSDHVWYKLPPSLSLEQMADVLYRTQRELNPLSNATLRNFGDALSEENYGDREGAFVYDSLNRQVVGVAYYPGPPAFITLKVPRKKGEMADSWQGRDVDDYLSTAEVFLRHLARP